MKRPSLLLLAMILKRNLEFSNTPGRRHTNTNIWLLSNNCQQQAALEYNLNCLSALIAPSERETDQHY